jgi:gluconolactonase
MVWNMDFEPPPVIEARMLSKMPRKLRRPVSSEWAEYASKDSALDCSLDGAAFDREGNLYLSDTPSGRILRVGRGWQWQEVVNTGGWPQGIAVHQDGSLWVADARRGLLRVEQGGQVQVLLEQAEKSRFMGLKDLAFDGRGNCYFTDQGQTGMHDPTGRVFRLGVDGRQEELLYNLPGPSGIVLGSDGKQLFVSAAKASALWQVDLRSDGSIANVSHLRGFFGSSGPGGLAMDAMRHLIVAHASLRCAFIVNMRGEVTHAVLARHMRSVNSVAFRPGTEELILVDGEQGALWTASMPDLALSLFSHV